MITIKTLTDASDVLSINGILKRSFSDQKDISRVEGKIRRGRPELTTEESRRISHTLATYGVVVVENGADAD